MGRYTITVEEMITNGYDIFDRERPFEDRHNRSKILEEKLIDRYRFCEIRFESPDRFKHYFNTKLRRIMPRYNELYATTKLVFNPLINYDTSEEFKWENERQEDIGKQAKVTSTDDTKERKSARHDEESKETTAAITTDETTDTTHDTLEENETTRTDFERKITEDTTYNEGFQSEEITDQSIVGNKEGTVSETGNITEGHTGTETQLFDETKQVDGESDRTTNSNLVENVKSAQYFSDTAQANLGVIPSETSSPSFEYLSTVGSSPTDRTNTTTETENITNTETTDTDSTKTTTFNKDIVTDKETTTTSKEDTTEDLDKNVSFTSTKDGTKNVETNETSQEIEQRDLHADRNIDYHSMDEGTLDKVIDTVLKAVDYANNNVIRNGINKSINKENKSTADVIDFSKRDTGMKGISAQELIAAYRRIIIDVDEMIIEDMKTCFMGVY